MSDDFFAGRAGHDHSQGVRSTADAIEQAYRRGFQQGAIARGAVPERDAESWLRRVYRWRFERALRPEIAPPEAVSGAQSGAQDDPAPIR